VSVLDAYHFVCWRVRYQANRRVRTSDMIGSRQHLLVSPCSSQNACSHYQRRSRVHGDPTPTFVAQCTAIKMSLLACPCTFLHIRIVEETCGTKILPVLIYCFSYCELDIHCSRQDDSHISEPFFDLGETKIGHHQTAKGIHRALVPCLLMNLTRTIN